LGSPVLCRFRHPGPASTMPFRACASLPPRGTGPRLACRGSVWAPSSGRNQREVDPVPSLHLRPGISRPRRLRVVAEAEAPGLPAALTAGMATTLHSFSPWVGVAINGARRVPRYLARRSAGGESPERPLISRATIRRASNCSSARKVIFARIVTVSARKGFEMVDMSKSLKPKDTASILGVSLQVLRSWMRNGYGPPYYKVQGRYHFMPEDVNKYLEGCRHG